MHVQHTRVGPARATARAPQIAPGTSARARSRRRRGYPAVCERPPNTRTAARKQQPKKAANAGAAAGLCKSGRRGGVGDDGEPDDTGRMLWPSSTLVVSLLLRCRQLLRFTHVLDLGSGSGFCGLVARQLARRVVMSDLEPTMQQLARRNLRLQRSSHAATTSVAAYGWA